MNVKIMNTTRKLSSTLTSEIIENTKFLKVIMRTEF